MVLDSRNYKYITPWIPNSFSPKVVVVTCFLQCQNHFLVLQRARKDQQHGLWGIPGGKLDQGESPLSGLIREVQEETTIDLSPISSSIKLLNKALSRTPSDGHYGLYLYHVNITFDVFVKINHEEHHAFRWVTLEEFESLDLLTAQGEAYYFVKEQLQKYVARPRSKKTLLKRLIYG